jgi:hypothetical protein
MTVPARPAPRLLYAIAPGCTRLGGSNLAVPLVVVRPLAGTTGGVCAVAALRIGQRRCRRLGRRRRNDAHSRTSQWWPVPGQQVGVLAHNHGHYHALVPRDAGERDEAGNGQHHPETPEPAQQAALRDH